MMAWGVAEVVNIILARVQFCKRSIWKTWQMCIQATYAIHQFSGICLFTIQSSYRALVQHICPAAMRWRFWDTCRKKTSFHPARMECKIPSQGIWFSLCVLYFCVGQHRIVHTTCATSFAASKLCPRQLSIGEFSHRATFVYFTLCHCRIPIWSKRQ